MLVTYKDTLGDLIKARKTYKTGTGIYTNQLIDRLKLLGGVLWLETMELCRSLLR